jgi:hypothetical protein
MGVRLTLRGFAPRSMRAAADGETEAIREREDGILPRFQRRHDAGARNTEERRRVAPLAARGPPFHGFWTGHAVLMAERSRRPVTTFQDTTTFSSELKPANT